MDQSFEIEPNTEAQNRITAKKQIFRDFKILREKSNEKSSD